MNRPASAAIGGLLLLCALSARPAEAVAQERADSLLHPLFRDHAVLQRDRPIAVWGIAAPGDRVTVDLNGRRAEADAERAGADPGALLLGRRAAVQSPGPFGTAGRAVRDRDPEVNPIAWHPLTPGT